LKATGTPQADIDKQVQQLKQQFADIRAGKTTGTAMVFGAPANYWADLLKRDIPAELKKLKQPVLVLQAGKDIQVVQADFDLIHSALDGKQAEFKVFPNVNHLMMPVEGPSTGAEYGKPGHVDVSVIKAISDWIAKTN
jgi:pimeloyl-ACP methyl ester carboxylesterase